MLFQVSEGVGEDVAHQASVTCPDGLQKRHGSQKTTAFMHGNLNQMNNKLTVHLLMLRVKA